MSSLGSDGAAGELQQAVRPAPRPVRAARALFYVNGAFWLVVAVYSVIRQPAGASANPALVAWVIAILMLGNAAAMQWLGWGIGRQNRRFYVLGIVWLAINILLTLTDEFGLYDLLILVLNAGTLALLIAARSHWRRA